MAISVKRKLFMEPTENKWENRAVLNPTVIQDKKGVEHMFYRAVSKDWVSSVGYAKITKGKIERSNQPILSPTKKWEKMGIEDPRITKIDDTYYLLYTAFDGRNARIAYATSNNLKDWDKKGIISPSICVKKARKLVKVKRYRDKWKKQQIYGKKVCLWDKDAMLFPEKINGKFVMLHRFSPDIQVVKFKDFSELQSGDFWQDYISRLGNDADTVSLHRRYDWESEHIGGGAVPIKTKNGWLIIYHGVKLERKHYIIETFSKIIFEIKGFLKITRRRPFVYHAGAAIVHLEKPEVEYARLKNPLFSPKYDWEKEGDINDVVFPEGTAIHGDKLKIYYGCADSKIGLAELSLKQLINQIEKDS
jgi:beta-1,2-mannobiose phosphorylase / 1,2-beta-oligomannan phosphorylase